MGILGMSGFEMGSNMEAEAFIGGASIVTNIKRTGDYALRISATGTGTGYCRISGYDYTGMKTSFSAATAYYRFYIYIATLPASLNEEIASLGNTGSGGKLYVRVTSAGNLQAYAADGTTQLGSDGATAFWSQTNRVPGDDNRVSPTLSL